MSAKKQKKQKGKTLSLQEFAASLDSTPSAGQNVVYAPATRNKVMSSWADEVEEDDMITTKERIVLPSAPRAARGPAYDDTQIPRDPPFTIHLGNLNYDIGEDDVHNFFSKFEITQLRLPRDPNNRLRGFGYVEFATRVDLVEALCMNEQILRGRQVRISLGQPGGDKDKDGRQRRGGGGQSFVDETPDDWRTMMSVREPIPLNDFGPRGGDRDFGGPRRDNFGGRDRDRDFGGQRRDRDNFDREPDFSRSDFGTNRPSYGPPRGDDRDFGGQRERRDYGRERRDDFGGGGGGGRDFGRRGGDYGGGRTDRDDREDGFSRGDFGTDRAPSLDFERGPVRERPDYGPPPPKSYDDGPRSNDFRGPPRGGGGNDSYGPPPPLSRDIQQGGGRRGYDSRSRSGSESGGERSEFRRQERRSDDDETPRQKSKSPPRERKKLVLAPRTVPKEPSSGEPVSNSAIFGGAKPVDTAAREREIEKKLEKLSIVEPEPRQISSPRDDDDRSKSPVPPPPPVENPWTKPRVVPPTTTTPVIDRDYRRRSSDESSPPEECKDTNSEPEDERDLRESGGGSASDSEFQKVERKPRGRSARGGVSDEGLYTGGRSAGTVGGGSGGTRYGGPQQQRGYSGGPRPGAGGSGGRRGN